MSQRRSASLMALALSAPMGGCQDCSGAMMSDAAEPDLTADAARSRFGQIVGQVFDLSQAPLGVVPGALVEVVGGPTTKTDNQGRFTLASVPVGERVLVKISVEARARLYPWSSTEVVVQVRGGETSYVAPRLLQGCAVHAGVDDTSATTVALDNGCSRTAAFASITIPPKGLVGADGSTFSGGLQVDLIPIPFPARQDGKADLSWYAALPGDMRAQQKDGAQVSLESLGAAELRLSDESTGAPLRLAPGQRVSLQLKAFREPAAGERFAAWSFDTERGLWVEEGAVSLKTVGGHRIAELSAPHLSWWNIDRPLAERSCVRGTLQVAGSPAIGVHLTAVGVDYGGSTNGETDSMGAFCVNTKASSQVVLDGWYPFSSTLVYKLDKSVATGGGGASCDQLASCTDVHTVDMAPVATVCVIGRLLDELDMPLQQTVSVFANVPVPPEQMAAGRVTGGYVDQVISGSGGQFCAQLPAAPGFTYSYRKQGSSRPNCQADAPAVTGTKGGSCGGAPAMCETAGDLKFFCRS